MKSEQKDIIINKVKDVVIRASTLFRKDQKDAFRKVICEKNYSRRDDFYP